MIQGLEIWMKKKKLTYIKLRISFSENGGSLLVVVKHGAESLNTVCTVLPLVFIGIVVGVYVHILILQSMWLQLHNIPLQSQLRTVMIAL